MMGRRLHLLPNGELLTRERAEAERGRAERDRRREEQFERARQLAQRVREGDDDAPMTLEVFLISVGLTPEEMDRMQDREEKERGDGGEGS